MHVATTISTNALRKSSASPKQQRRSSQSKSPDVSPSIPTNNIDPSLADSGLNKSLEARQSPPDATSFDDHAGISAAVQKALQVIIAIDPSLNPGMRDQPAGSSAPSGDSSKSDILIHSFAGGARSPGANGVVVEPIMQHVEGASNTSSDTVITNITSIKGRETDMDVDADGDADSDGDEVNQEVHYTIYVAN